MADTIKKHPKIVCLGGGIGTVQVIRAIRPFATDITVVVSMADDGGSAGRLRRLYSVPPPGDLINCLAALSDAEPILKQLLTYRLEGNRWGNENSIEGHKIGNLILVALTKILGDFNKALLEAERIFSCKGKILPSTFENVSIYAQTTKGEEVMGEETIDLGIYKDSLYRVFIKPNNVQTPIEVVGAINEADFIIVGPGDLYTTILPVLLVPDIQKALDSSGAQKVFVTNIANKRETKGYTIDQHLESIQRHAPYLKFDYILINNNNKPPLSSQSSYEYIDPRFKSAQKYTNILHADIIDEKFPIQHDIHKLGKIIYNKIINK